MLMISHFARISPSVSMDLPGPEIPNFGPKFMYFP